MRNCESPQKTRKPLSPRQKPYDQYRNSLDTPGNSRSNAVLAGLMLAQTEGIRSALVHMGDIPFPEDAEPNVVEDEPMNTESGEDLEAYKQQAIIDAIGVLKEEYDYGVLQQAVGKIVQSARVNVHQYFAIGVRTAASTVQVQLRIHKSTRVLKAKIEELAKVNV